MKQVWGNQRGNPEQWFEEKHTLAKGEKDNVLKDTTQKNYEPHKKDS